MYSPTNHILLPCLALLAACGSPGQTDGQATAIPGETAPDPTAPSSLSADASASHGELLRPYFASGGRRGGG